MSVATEIRIILTTWFCVLVVLLCVDQASLMIDPIYKMHFWYWNLAVPIEIVSWHIIIRSVANHIRRMNKNQHRIAIVGATMLGSELAKIFIEDEAMAVEFVGFFDDRQRVSEDGFSVDVSKLAGDTEQLIKLAKSGNIDVVYIALPLRAELRIKNIVEELGDSTASVHFVPDLFIFELLSASLNNIKGIPVISSTIPRSMALTAP